MALNLTITIAEFLQNNPEQKFTAREITEWVYAHYPDHYRQKQQKSKATAIILDNDQVLSKRSTLQKKISQNKNHGRKTKKILLHGINL